MRVYVETKQIEQITSELNQIYRKLVFYQQEIEVVYQSMDGMLKTEASIRQPMQSLIENIEEEKRRLLTMKLVLAQISVLYCQAEKRIMEQCESVGRPLYERNFFSEIDDQDTRKFLENYPNYAKRLEAAYRRASGTARTLYDKYRKEIVIASMLAKTSYHKNGKLYIAYEDNMEDSRKAESIYYHETGHFIVGKEGWVKGTKMNPSFQMFDQAVKKDVAGYLSKVESRYRSQLEKKYSGKRLEMLVQQKTKESLEAELGGDNRHVLDGVSDMIDAASNGRYSITYGHADGYWSANSTRQANEAFAELYAADFCQDTGEIEFIKKQFPNMYEAYEQLKQEALIS